MAGGRRRWLCQDAGADEELVDNKIMVMPYYSPSTGVLESLGLLWRHKWSWRTVALLPFVLFCGFDLIMRRFGSSLGVAVPPHPTNPPGWQLTLLGMLTMALLADWVVLAARHDDDARAPPSSEPVVRRALPLIMARYFLDLVTRLSLAAAVLAISVGGKFDLGLDLPDAEPGALHGRRLRVPVGFALSAVVAGSTFFALVAAPYLVDAAGWAAFSVGMRTPVCDGAMATEAATFVRLAVSFGLPSASHALLGSRSLLRLRPATAPPSADEVNGACEVAVVMVKECAWIMPAPSAWSYTSRPRWWDAPSRPGSSTVRSRLQPQRTGWASWSGRRRGRPPFKAMRRSFMPCRDRRPESST